MMRALLLVVALLACDKGKRTDAVAPGSGSSAVPCVRGGCSGEACVDATESGATACVYLDEFACYGTAKCERQPTGECGWTPTPELTQCIATARAKQPPPVTAPVVTP